MEDRRIGLTHCADATRIGLPYQTYLKHVAINRAINDLRAAREGGIDSVSILELAGYAHGG